MAELLTARVGSITEGELDLINRRVDKALDDNRRAEALVVTMAAAIFLLGLGSTVVAYWRLNPYFGTGTILAQALLYWPIREILKLRRDNLVLQTLPAMMSIAPRDRAAATMIKALERLWR